MASPRAETRLGLRALVATGMVAGFMALAPEADAGIASALIREGDPLAGWGMVSAISNSAVNHSGGYAFTLNSSDGATYSHVWGNAAGGMGALIRTEGIFGNLEQNSFESFFGISNSGSVAYSPSCTDSNSGETGLDGVWLDDAWQALEGQPVAALPGQYWSFASRPGITADGTPYWIGGITDTVGGSTQNRGLFYDGSVVFMGGDLLPGLPYEIKSASSGIDFDYRFSADGSNYLAPVLMESGSTTDDGSLVMNGAGLTIGGSLVREASAVPGSAGGLPGENWDNFDFMGITDAGDYMFTGDTDAATGLDEFIVRNGEIIFREGDVVGGEILSGAIEGAYMNNNSDIAYIWDIVDGSGTLEALYLEDQLLLTEGDAVDWDGDGNIDNNAILTNFTGISALTLGDRDENGMVELYFTADVDIDGTVLEGGFFMSVAIPGPGGLMLLGGGLLIGRSRRRNRA